MNASILALDKKENLMLLNRMTDRLFSSSTTFHSALFSLLLVVTTMFANTAAAQPPQLAVANASVIDPVTAETSIQSTTAEFYAGASIDEGLSYVSCIDPLDSVDLESSLVVENDHVGSAGNIYVLAIVGEESYMLVGDVFLPWDGLRESLEPFATKTLQATETISVLDQVQFGPAGIEQGELAIYIGYELISDTNKIYYSATPLRVNIVPGAMVSRSQYVGVDSCSPYAVKRTPAIVYDTGTITNPATTEFDLLLDLYVPDVDLAGESVPSMVIIHGGGFKGGSRSQPALVDYAERFAAQGYLAISIDYRLAGQVPELNPQFASLYNQSVSTEEESEAEQALGMFSAMEDSLKAMAWLENYAQEQGFEIYALGLLGGSAGAITSLNVGYGLNDYGFAVPEFKVVVNHWGNLAIDLESSKPSITADEAALISVHGTEDPTVLYSGSVEIHARANEIGLTNELITSEGAGHGFGVNRLWDSESFAGSGYTKGERILNFVNAAMLTPYVNASPFPVSRTTSQITFEEQYTDDTFLGGTHTFDFYRNEAYQCGLSGNYTFMVANPANGDANTEAPLWVYLHGGGSGYFDDDGVTYYGQTGQTADNWNHEETFNDLLVKQLRRRTIDENDQPIDITLTRRIQEGYRVVLVSMCDHDTYSGLGTPYLNNPNSDAQVNGMQATMAAVDYTTRNYPTTHVFAHGTSAGGIGVYNLAVSYAAEGTHLTGIIADFYLGERALPLLDMFAGDSPYALGYDSEKMSEKIGYFADVDQRVAAEDRINDGFDEVPILWIGGDADPFCIGHRPAVPEAAALGLNNCEYVWDELNQAVDNQPNSPHQVSLLPGEVHIPTNYESPAHDIVDNFIGNILAGNPQHPFLENPNVIAGEK